jgi:hypothetical protein
MLDTVASPLRPRIPVDKLLGNRICPAPVLVIDHVEEKPTDN